MTGDWQHEGYIVEFITLGDSVKVTAFDPVTLKEACIVGPLKALKSDLAKLSVRKLEYVINKDLTGDGDL